MGGGEGWERSEWEEWERSEWEEWERRVVGGVGEK